MSRHLYTGSFKEDMIDDAKTKTINAAQLFQLVFLTLLFGVLLNSSYFYLRAKTWDDSIERTITVNVLRPFAAISDAVKLNALRGRSREAIGLTRDDKIDNFEFKRTNAAITEPLPSTTLPRLTPENKLTSWIIGDSLAATPGESLVAQLPTSTFDVYGLESKVSTGLARPDVFNWFSFINDFVSTRHPKTMIVSFGANDDQSLYSDGGSIGPFASDAWRKEYSNRISSTLDFLATNGVYTLWVEIPPVRDPVRNDRYQIINDITRAAIAAHPNTSSYIETKAAFTTAEGNYNDSLPINGVDTLLRSPDGIHFTRAGGDIIARLVIAKLHTLYAFE